MLELQTTENNAVFTTSGKGFIDTCTPKHSPVKNRVAALLRDYLDGCDDFHSDGYVDTNSSEITSFLNTHLPEYRWIKNSSQRPFDIYSIEARLAIEIKSVSVRKNKSGKIMSHEIMLTNASVYPDEINITDVVPKKHLETGIDQSIDFDVLVVCVERCGDLVVGYCIVDGSFWGIAKELYQDCRDLFRQINQFKLALLENVHIKYKNRFAKCILDGAIDVDLDVRKLITVSNPLASADLA